MEREESGLLSFHISDSATDTPSHLALLIRLSRIKIHTTGLPFPWRKELSIVSSKPFAAEVASLVTPTIPGTNKGDSSVPHVLEMVLGRKFLICFSGSPKLTGPPSQIPFVYFHFLNSKEFSKQVIMWI